MEPPLANLCFLSPQIHQGVPVTPPWVETFGTQIQNRSQPPGKLLSQLLPVGAPVLRPTSCTLQLFMGPPVTYQPGKVDKGRGLGAPGGGGPVLFSYLSLD